MQETKVDRVDRDGRFEIIQFSTKFRVTRRDPTKRPRCSQPLLGEARG